MLTEAVCASWKEKRCNNRGCPLRHPGRDLSRKSNSSSGEISTIALDSQRLNGQQDN